MVATASLIAIKNIGDGEDFIESKKHSGKAQEDKEENNSDHDLGHVHLRCHSGERRKSLFGNLVNIVIENREEDDRNHAGGE